MPKAYDRVKNANNSADNFIKTPYWSNEVEDAFEAWNQQLDGRTLEQRLAQYLESSVAVSFKQIDDSICCTLAHQPSRDAGDPYLLTGWAERACEAMAVAEFKLEVMLKGIWAEPPQQ